MWWLLLSLHSEWPVLAALLSAVMSVVLMLLPRAVAALRMVLLGQCRGLVVGAPLRLLAAVLLLLRLLLRPRMLLSLRGG